MCCFVLSVLFYAGLCCSALFYIALFGFELSCFVLVLSCFGLVCVVLCCFELFSLL